MDKHGHNVPSLWHDMEQPVRDGLLADPVQVKGRPLAKLQRQKVLDDGGALTEFGEWVVRFGRNLLELERQKLEVWGWQGHRYGRDGGPTREIMVAKSKAAVARAAGVNRPAQLFNLSTTGNDMDINTAMTEPGVVFWRPYPNQSTFRKARKGT